MCQPLECFEDCGQAGRPEGLPLSNHVSPRSKRRNTICCVSHKAELPSFSLEATQSSHQSPSHPTKSTMVGMIQRSGAMSIKSHIARIIQSCESGSTETGNSVPPEAECSILADWAHDAFYQVVISKHGGIHALLKAMDTFSDSPNLQAHCCVALGSLCFNNDNNRRLILSSGGIPTISSAIRKNLQSTQIQIAALKALKDILNLSNSQQGLDEFLVPTLRSASDGLRELLLHMKAASPAPNVNNDADLILSLLQRANSEQAKL